MDPSELLRLAETTAPALFDRRQREALQTLAAHHDDFLKLLDCDPATAVRLASALWRYWFLSGSLSSALPLVRRAIESPHHLPEEWKPRAFVTVAVMSFFAGRVDDAAAHVAQFHDGDDSDAAFARSVAGWVAQARGDWAGASEEFMASLQMFRAIGHRWGEALSLLNLGEVARSAGDLPAARRFYEEDLVIYRELGEQSAIAATLCNLGFVALAANEDPSALLAEALEICLSIGNRQFIPGIIVGFGAWCAITGGVSTAARLIGAADAYLARLGATYEPADQVERERALARIHAAGDRQKSDTIPGDEPT